MRPLRFLVVLLASVFAALNLHAAPLASLYDYKVNSLDGKPVDLSNLQG
jgi:hypothetical protein